MKLTVKERIVLAQLYPRESNLLTQTLIRDVSRKVQMDQAELKEIDFKSSSTGFVWDGEKAKGKDKEIEFSEAELNMLKDQVERLDKEKKISQDLLDLCLKIKNG
jgi:hypothetical protein